jgi:hypothetical protein
MSTIRSIASSLRRPSSGPLFTRTPSPVVATPVTFGSCSPVSTTTRTGRSNVRAKSRSRWSCAGTAMIAPWP